MSKNLFESMRIQHSIGSIFWIYAIDGDIMFWLFGRERNSCTCVYDMSSKTIYPCYLGWSRLEVQMGDSMVFPMIMMKSLLKNPSLVPGGNPRLIPVPRPVPLGRALNTDRDVRY